MKLDEFAFLNRQLAEMLRSGLPLEGALRQLVETLHDRALRNELQQLEADLARGTPLTEAVGRRRLPELFVRLVRLGEQGHDLPGLLTLLADYYQRRHALGTRLQALVVYPALVLAAAAGLALFFVWFRHAVLIPLTGDLFRGVDSGHTLPALLTWMPAVWMVGVILGMVGLGLWPATRRWLRWRLPGFREANLAQLAAALHLLLARGGHLDESLALLAELEGPSPAGRELVRWRQRLAAGAGRLEVFAAPSRTFPRLFVWLVTRAGSDLAGGFRRAAELYHQRAQHQAEMLLHAALPVAVLFLGLLILVQLSSSMVVVIQFLNAMGLVGVD